MSSKKDRQNCFLDLQRAATSFCLNPQGKTWRIFLDHAYQILQGKRKWANFAEKLKEIEEKSAFIEEKEVINLADEMLTLGILVKP